MSRGTLDPAALTQLSLTGLSPSLAGLPRPILLALSDCVRGPKPRGARTPVWALPISLAATLRIDVSFRKTFFFLFLRLLRCFSSPGSLPYTMDSCMGDGGLLRRVSPFRHLRITGYLRLPAAFRSLSRLSSALSAKASTLRSWSFNLLWLFLPSPPFTPSVMLLGGCLIRFLLLRQEVMFRKTSRSASHNFCCVLICLCRSWCKSFKLAELTSEADLLPVSYNRSFISFFCQLVSRMSCLSRLQT